MFDIITWLSGKKSYLMALLLVMYAVGGYFTGHLNLNAVLELFWGAGTISALRAAIAKVE